MQAARVRLFGPEAAEAAPPDPGPTADEVIEEYAELEDEDAPPMEEGKRLTLAQRIMKMSIAEKIKLATKGNKEARSYLLRDSNKLVAVAVIRSPKHHRRRGAGRGQQPGRAGRRAARRLQQPRVAEGVPGEGGAGEEPEGPPAGGDEVPRRSCASPR